jgi:hypothetical protein
MTDTNRVQGKRNGTSSILAILGLIAIMVMFTESMRAGVFLAQYVSPLSIQTPRGAISGPLLPNATAFNYIFLSALGISIVGVFVTLLVNNRAGEIQMYEPVEQGAVAI